MMEVGKTPFNDSAARKGREARRLSVGACGIVLVMLFTHLISVRISAADFGGALEYKVKAGYLFNFAKFVEWPATAFSTATSPFVIGVIDEGEVAAVVQSVLQGKLVDGRPVQVRSVKADSVGRDIHILLVTRAAAAAAAEVRAALGSAPTLLVGETEFFADREGMVGFTREAETIRLSLNLERTAEAGLKVSSKLSSVARVVRPKRAS